jgi:YHS domain-containing protein
MRRTTGRRPTLTDGHLYILLCRPHPWCFHGRPTVGKRKTDRRIFRSLKTISCQAANRETQASPLTNPLVVLLPIDPPWVSSTVTAEEAVGTAEHGHGHETYYFCSEGCLRKFRDDPERDVTIRARRSRRRRPASMTPVPCIAKCGRSVRDHARTAAWRLSRSLPRAPGATRSTLAQCPSSRARSGCPSESLTTGSAPSSFSLLFKSACPEPGTGNVTLAGKRLLGIPTRINGARFSCRGISSAVLRSVVPRRPPP